MNYTIDYLCVNRLQKIYTFHNPSMTIGDIAPKINSPQAETHCCSKNELQNISVLYKHTNIGTIKIAQLNRKAQ